MEDNNVSQQKSGILGLDVRLKEFMEYLFVKDPKAYKTQAKVSKAIGVDRSNLSTALNGSEKYLTEGLVKKIVSAFPEISENWLLTGEGEMLNTPEPEKSIIPRGELKPKEYSHTLQVRVVTNKAKAGWADGYYNDEYLEDMPIITIDADENHKGRYLAFEVAGDSMEPDYLEGDIVICREVQRHLWNSKLHIRDWDFVIAHYTEGIMLKEIIEHDVEKGIITCRSLNPNHKDFKIKLREVSSLYNVVEVRQKGKNKRWNRAKDFFEAGE